MQISSWDYCRSAIDNSKADLTDGMQAAMIDFMDNENRLQELRFERLKYLSCYNVPQTRSKLDRRTGKRIASPSTSVQFMILNPAAFQEIEQEERKINARQAKIRAFFDTVSPTIQEACLKSGCKVPTVVGLAEYRADLANKCTLMERRLNEKMIGMLQSSRRTSSDEVQASLEYKALEDEVARNLISARQIILLLDGYIQKLSPASKLKSLGGNGGYSSGD
jgi:hypothetical protein